MGNTSKMNKDVDYEEFLTKAGGFRNSMPTRRDFMKTSSLMALALGVAAREGSGADTEANIKDLYAKLIPPDKGLGQEWFRSLTARGTVRAYIDPKALEHIGMPVGGMFTGTLYLGGDGRLCHWDIFNRQQRAVTNRSIAYKGKKLDAIWGLNFVYPRNGCIRSNNGLHCGLTARTIKNRKYKI